jgi:hypothetical protein
LAVHGFLELELNMMAVSGYFFYSSITSLHFGFGENCCFELIFSFGFFMQIQINEEEYKCASTQRVVNRMANIGWVTERAIPLLKKDPSMGAKALRKS